MPARARSKLWQKAIASNKDVYGSAGYPATRLRLGERVSKQQRACGNRDHREPAYDLSALFDPMVTVSRCLDPVCSLALPLVKAVAPAGGRASPGSST